jgi:hypothetical protein
VKYYFFLYFFLICSCAGPSITRRPSGITLSTYDRLVLADKCAFYLTMGNSAQQAYEYDQSGNSHPGKYGPTGSTSSSAPMPNGDLATDFDGVSQFLEVENSHGLSISVTGALTFEAWIRPDILQFTHEEGNGYVWWAGKGGPNQQEYAFRIYSTTNTENPPRPNRISDYAFNLAGGLGSGSYFQDVIAIGEWIHVIAVFNAVDTSPTYPTGYVKIYKDGVLRKTTPLNQYSVIPQSGSAPIRVATRDFNSFFQGAIGKVALYQYELSPIQISAHFTAMTAAAH